MAGATHSIEIDDAQIQRALDEIIKFGETPETYLKGVGEYFEVVVDQRFRSEQGPGGVPWRKLSKRTLARKKGSKILTESSRLRGSFHPQIQGDTLLFGTNVIYAAIHQFGGGIERAAYSIKQRLLARPNGQLVRRRGTKLARYAKKSAKNVREVVATIGAHNLYIPPRPILGIDETDKKVIPEIVANALMRRIGARR